MSSIPTLFGKLGSHHQLKVWCKYCERYHAHGFPEGHRAAHYTNPNSPYNKTGYYIKLKKSSD